MRSLLITRLVLVEGKSSVCLICMKYGIIIFLLLSLSSWVKFYYRIMSTYARTSMREHTHTHTHAHTHTHTHTHTHPSPTPYVLALFIGAHP